LILRIVASFFIVTNSLRAARNYTLHDNNFVKIYSLVPIFTGCLPPFLPCTYILFICNVNEYRFVLAQVRAREIILFDALHGRGERRTTA